MANSLFIEVELKICCFKIKFYWRIFSYTCEVEFQKYLNISRNILRLLFVFQISISNLFISRLGVGKVFTSLLSGLWSEVREFESNARSKLPCFYALGCEFVPHLCLWISQEKYSSNSLNFTGGVYSVENEYLGSNLGKMNWGYS